MQGTSTNRRCSLLTSQDWNNEASVEDVMSFAKLFHPSIQAICESVAQSCDYNQH
jgi:hypothetical protein